MSTRSNGILGEPGYHLYEDPEYREKAVSYVRLCPSTGRASAGLPK